MRIKGEDRFCFSFLGYSTVTVFSLICVLPIVFVVSGSFTDESSIHLYGYRLIPKVFSSYAYHMAFANPKMIINAYSITIMLTIFGTILGLFICAMTAYVLQRQYFRSRNFFALFFYFTTLFSGGLVPWYILMIRYLHLKNSFLALLLPPLIAVFDIIIMRSFLKSVPEALAESAKIDGAGEFRTFFQIYLPILKPALATVGLFIALRYWNDWYNAMLFISEKRYFPLQFYLYNMLTSMEFAITAASQGGITVKAYPAESFKLAMTVIATGPIIFLYPFVQKYFIKGLTVGAVRG